MMTSVCRHRRPDILDSIPLDRHTVIEASAGTGKTYTIEHLVIELLLRTDARIDQILVVTFTEKATGELKMRVRQKIEELVNGAGEAGPDEPAWEIGDAERERLDLALSAFDAAPISTIHSFCQRVLTENAFDGSRLFEQTQVDGDEAFSAAFREALRVDLASDPDHVPWLAAWLERNSVDALESLLRECHKARGQLRPVFDPEVLEAASEFDVDDLDGEALKTELRSAGLKGVSLNSVVREFEALREVVQRTRGGSVPSILRGLAAWRGGRPNGAESWIRERLPDRASDGPLTRRCRELLDVVSDSAIPFEVAVVHRFLPLVQQRLEIRKRELGLFDFDDMLQLVHRGLGNERLVQALRERYRFALIDEFQDTDEVQWDIFRTIFFESDEHRLYIIGDPKQAIYRFRGADVHTYFRAKDQIVSAGGALVSLAMNYRSTPGVIAAYNQILDQRATPPFFSRPGTYDDPVGCGDPSLEVVDAEGRPLSPVVLMHLASRDSRVGSYRDGCARFIAGEVKRLLDGNFFVKRKDTLHPLRANDVFVLTRTGSEGLEVGHALREAGVPHAFYKQDGLFQTQEARDVLDLLAAVVAPTERDLRVRAWLTPFFALTVEEAARLQGVSTQHLLVERLLDWHWLASNREFQKLFTSILEQSGLVRRLLLLDSSERALTNYHHLFEILLEHATNSPCTAVELVTWLRRRLDSTSNDGQDSNVQRLETERDAVQIMTMHKSKGLEAAVVFLFGGWGRSRSNSIHILPGPNGERLIHVGKLLDPELVETAQREDDEENQRLFYVALTRAKARLYLPYFAPLSPDEARALGIDSDGKTYSVNGAYRCVNQRLVAIVNDGGAKERTDDVGVPLFERLLVDCDGDSRLEAADEETGARTWEPPDELLEAVEAHDESPEFAALRRRHAGFAVTSYSRMKQTAKGASWGGDIDRFEEMEGIEADPVFDETESSLRGGRETGLFLHDLLEQAPIDSLWSAGDPETWLQQDSISQLMSHCARRYGIAEKHFGEAARVVHTALTAPVALGDAGVIQGISSAPVLLREMEFLYPFPEEHHPRLTEAIREDGFSIDRGFVKGFVDVIFTHRGRAWVGDWKSDRLPRWDARSISLHVQRHYSIQARLYSLALVKMLGIQDEAAYEERFGGLLFLFIRAMQPGTGEGPMDGVGTRGVYHQRPTFGEILQWEHELRTRAIWKASV